MSSLARPTLVVPPGATDTHMHIYDTGIPALPGAPALPGHFPVEAYRAVQQRMGLTRVVVVQPNAYGADNRVTLEAIAALGPSARGVGVVRPDVSDAELERLTAGGIRAIRFFGLPGGVLSWDAMDALAARVQPFGWSAIIQLDGRTMPEHEAQIARLPGRSPSTIPASSSSPSPPTTRRSSRSCGWWTPAAAG